MDRVAATGTLILSHDLSGIVRGPANGFVELETVEPAGPTNTPRRGYLTAHAPTTVVVEHDTRGAPNLGIRVQLEN